MDKSVHTGRQGERMGANATRNYGESLRVNNFLYVVK